MLHHGLKTAPERVITRTIQSLCVSQIITYFPCRLLRSFFSRTQSRLFFTDLPRTCLTRSLHHNKHNSISSSLLTRQSFSGLGKDMVLISLAAAVRHSNMEQRPSAQVMMCETHHNLGLLASSHHNLALSRTTRTRPHIAL